MSFDLVFFGGTGDLTWLKLMPALLQAFRSVFREEQAYRIDHYLGKPSGAENRFFLREFFVFREDQ